MRSKLLGLFLGCGLAAAAMTSAFACDYQTNASANDSPPQHTAQAQPSSDTTSQ